MTQQQAMTAAADRVLEVLVSGNLSVLTAPERLEYYNRVCDSLELNPLTKPFEFLTLNNKLVLYATKSCTDQLRQIRGVSITVEDQRQVGELYLVTVSAIDSSGRRDSDMGAVAIGSLKGEALANAMLKSVTKAKRRVTLSICGLGLLDETEVEDIPAASKRPPVVMPQARVEPPANLDVATGELLPEGGTEGAAGIGTAAPSDYSWTFSDLNAVLGARALTMRDLAPVLGDEVTRDNVVALVSTWLEANPGKGLAELATEAVDYHTSAPAVT